MFSLQLFFDVVEGVVVLILPTDLGKFNLFSLQLFFAVVVLILQTDLEKSNLFSLQLFFAIVEGVVLIFSMRQGCPINWISLLLN